MSRAMLHATAASTLALALLPGTAQAVRVDYTLGFGVERNDNLLLAPSDPIALTILRPGLGFGLSEQTSTWQADFRGRGEYLDYRDDRFDNTVEGALSGRVNWVVVPDRLALTLEDNLALQPVNTLAPDAPANRQQVNVLAFGPTLFFDIGRTLRGTAELRYINSDAEITDQFNSDRVNMALRATKELGATSRVSGNLQAQRVDFDTQAVARDYTRSDLYGRYERTLASFDLALDAGVSRIEYRQGGGGRSEPLVRLVATWRPDERQRVIARLSNQFSDTASDALSGISAAGGTTAGVPERVTVGGSVVNASPYEQRGIELQYAYTGPRFTASVVPFRNRLRYVDATAFDQDASGVRLDANWLVRPRFSLGGYGSLSRIDYQVLDRRDELRIAGIYGEYRWTRQLSSRLTLTRQQRDLSIAGQDATRDSALFTLTWRNR